MGINGIFKQISHNILEKLKQEPGLVKVFTDAMFINESNLMQDKGIFYLIKSLNK